MTTDQQERPPSRRILLRVLVALGLVSIGSGTAGIVGGPAAAPGGEPANASVDSEYRFVNTFWLAAGAILLWSLRRPEERTTATRGTLAVAAAGGLPRLVSWSRVGPPHPVFRATTVLELVVVPVVLWWHSRVIRPVRVRGVARSR